MSCSGKCSQCENYDHEDDYCYELDTDADNARTICEQDDFDFFEPMAPEEFPERYIQDLEEAEDEIEARNISGTDIERLKSKFPDKKFI